MNATQIEVVRTSFAKLMPLSEETASLFYDRLFELRPDLRSLFDADMEEQGRKLMQMISVAVANLDRQDQLVPVVRQLGRDHVRFGVKKEDYDVVGEALVWTLGQQLGPAFTPETQAAWISAYVLISTEMLNGAAA